MKTSLLVAILSLFGFSFSSFAIEKTINLPEATINQKIDLNKADAKILSKSIKGIGPKRAEAIVRYRTEHGVFKSVKDLALIKGIGKSFVNKNLIELEKIFLIK